MISKKIALLFPGQGAHTPSMLNAVRSLPGFKEKYQVVCDYLKSNPLKQIDNQDLDLINTNSVSSTLTVLASIIALEQFLQTNSNPIALFSGYSVGQWTALYAANVISFEKLIETIAFRAELMDRCGSKRPGGMLGVIGVPPEPLLSLCDQLSSPEKTIVISNYNCYGQYTLAGDLELMELAQNRIADLAPKKVVRIPVAGAWHTPLMDGAAVEFEKYLRSSYLNAPTTPVMDNVTGDYLKTDSESMITALSKHVNHPVQWHSSMLRIIADGVSECVEVGFGNTLTKFGLFINRTIEHRSFYPNPVTT